MPSETLRFHNRRIACPLPGPRFQARQVCPKCSHAARVVVWSAFMRRRWLFTLNPIPPLLKILPFTSDAQAAFVMPHHRRAAVRNRQSRSHSSREIPACRSIFASRFGPMSLPCGLGIVSASSPRCMNSCLPPANGPENPARRSAASGGSFHFANSQIHAVDRWNRQMT